MSSTVLTFVIVGVDDHPIFEADLAVRGMPLCCVTLKLPSICRDGYRSRGIRGPSFSPLLTMLLDINAHVQENPAPAMTGRSTCTSSCCTLRWTPWRSSSGRPAA